MKKVLCAVGLMALLSVPALGAANDSHTVTVTVQGINEVNVDNDVSITIDTATAGSLPDAKVDSSAKVFWTTNANNKKITVKCDSAWVNFTVKVLATGVTKSSGSGSPLAAAEVTLDTTAKDFITGAGKSAGFATLQYTASCDLTPDPATSEVRTVTYTLQ